jgi:hypothetical protein
MYLLDYIDITKRTTVATTSKIRVVASLTGRLFRIQNGKYKVVASLKKQLIRVVASLTKHVTSSLLNLVYLPCKQQLADIFVKELPQVICVSTKCMHMPSTLDCVLWWRLCQSYSMPLILSKVIVPFFSLHYRYPVNWTA